MELKSGWGGLLVSLVSCTCFLLLHQLSPWFTERFFPVLWSNLKKRGKAEDWRNYTVSYVFIWACSLSFVWILLNEGGDIFADLVHAESDRCRKVIVFATGYFIADTIDMYRGNALTWDMVLHHGVIILAFGSSILTDKYACYLLSTLVAETNTIFLHMRKLMLLAGIRKESRKYRATLACLLLGFPCQRVLPHLWLLNNTYNDRNKFEATWMFVVAFLGMLVINGLNFVLLRSLLVADWHLLFPRLSRSSPTALAPNSPSTTFITN